MLATRFTEYKPAGPLKGKVREISRIINAHCAVLISKCRDIDVILIRKIMFYKSEEFSFMTFGNVL
jgi:hypothetical protein